MKKLTRSTIFLLPAAALFFPAFAFAAVTLSISNSLPGMAPVSAGANPGVWIQGFYGLALMLGGVLAFGAVVYGGVHLRGLRRQRLEAVGGEGVDLERPHRAPPPRRSLARAPYR